MRILFYLWQFTWCLPQNLAGLVLYLIHRREGCGRFRYAFTAHWKRRGCTSLGCFLLMEEHCMEDRPLLVHEYGHTMQSCVLGWLYFPVIVLPSVLWFHLPALRRLRKRRHISYYSFYPEAWANRWGEKISGERAAR